MDSGDKNLLERLEAIVGVAGVLEAAEAAKRTAGVLRSDAIQCRALVRPSSTDEVSAVLRLCREAGCSVVTQGGLTGLVHGADATAAQIVLSLERMNQIEQIDVQQRVAVAQAGVTLQALQEAVEAESLMFPLDLGARGSATIGGNAATNAGGNRVIRYGMMRERVLGLEAVLADGTVISSMNRMIKNNTGYDLKQLFIGSEGTLGVITRLVLRLAESPASQNVALVAVPNFDATIRLLKHMDQGLGGGLSAFELMWREFYQLVTTPPAQSAPPLPSDYPFYVLIEFQGGHETADHERFITVLEEAMENGLVADAAIASSERELHALWALRDDVLQTARYGMPFAFDVSLPIADMEAYVHTVQKSLSARWPDSHCWVFGHMGDGNLHVVVHTGNSADRSAVEKMVYDPLVAIGGSVSAEHGIGLEKKNICRCRATRRKLR